MNKEQVENYITELESMFELSELEEHSRNILKVGIYINKLQQENKQLKEKLNKAIEWIYIVQQDKDNKHLEPIINTDELDELLEILRGDNNEK